MLVTIATRQLAMSLIKYVSIRDSILLNLAMPFINDNTFITQKKIFKKYEIENINE